MFCGLVYAYSPERDGARFAALFVFLTAGISDVIDGYIARNWDQRSELGTRLDPLADKLLLSLGFVFVAANGWFEPGIPLWFPVLVAGRDAFIVAGAALITERRGRVRVQPSLLGKANTFLMMSTLITALLNFPYTRVIMYATLVGACMSLASYTLNGLRQAQTLKQPSSHG